MASIPPQSQPPLPSLQCAVGSSTTSLTDSEIRQQINDFVDRLGIREDVLLIPPDYTRIDSEAGKITQMICERYNFIPASSGAHQSQPGPSSPQIEILPALGTHAPMTETEIANMFGPELSAKDPSPFLVHDWRNDVVDIGAAPAEMVRTATDGMVDRTWPAQVNRRVWEKRAFDTEKQAHKSVVLSIGQVVPHEVMGMANYNKNLFVGTGGVQAIDLSHFIGAVHGMERMMGRGDNPLRDILNFSSKNFLEGELDLWYILTVMGPDEQTGDPCMRGLFIGNDIECYTRACELSRQVNFKLLENPIKRCVVHLKEEKFHSTWLGNKSIYRTRMAMADDGELIILAPGVRKFGEDPEIDRLIRKYGYRGTPQALKMMDENKELQEGLSTVAHLIHGSSEGRFRITYCPGHLTKEEIVGVGFGYADLKETLKKYDPSSLYPGWNSDEDGEFFFVKDPALGLWACESRFESPTSIKENTK